MAQLGQPEQDFYFVRDAACKAKLRHCEKATKFEKKNLPLVKTSERFFQIFVAFSENLNFSKAIRNEKCLFLLGADIDIWFRSVINNPHIDFNVAHDGEFSLNCLIFYASSILGKEDKRIDQLLLFGLM